MQPIDFVVGNKKKLVDAFFANLVFIAMYQLAENPFWMTSKTVISTKISNSIFNTTRVYSLSTLYDEKVKCKLLNDGADSGISGR